MRAPRDSHSLGHTGYNIDLLFDNRGVHGASQAIDTGARAKGSLLELSRCGIHWSSRRETWPSLRGKYFRKISDDCYFAIGAKCPYFVALVARWVHGCHCELKLALGCIGATDPPLASFRLSHLVDLGGYFCLLKGLLLVDMVLQPISSFLISPCGQYLSVIFFLSIPKSLSYASGLVTAINVSLVDAFTECLDLGWFTQMMVVKGDECDVGASHLARRSLQRCRVVVIPGSVPQVGNNRLSTGYNSMQSRRSLSAPTIGPIILIIIHWQSSLDESPSSFILHHFPVHRIFYWTLAPLSLHHRTPLGHPRVRLRVVEASSEDPFHIYDLLNKKHENDIGSVRSQTGDTLKYPQEDVESNKATQIPKEDGEVSACSGHFQKATTLRSQGSFLQFMEDLVKNSKLKSTLVDIDKTIDAGNANSDLLNNRMNVMNSLLDLDKLKSLEVAQKAKIKWSIEGDENSKYFYENDVMEAVSYFFQHGSFPKGGNSSFIALIPKTQNANMVKDFRPISLIGSLYKIIAKILANRLVVLMGDIVSDVQLAFVADRQILDDPFMLTI
ncbi:hypothetical protein Tco_0018606 [Tanacetum coccineum]